MSDTVKKWMENPTQRLISAEEKREKDILDLITIAVKADKVVQVETRARQIQRETNGASLLVSLQLACDEEGLIWN